MTALALIHRELRAEARRNWNYGLRLLAGLAVTCVFVSTSFTMGSGAMASGGLLFMGANFVLYHGIWLIAPLLTADCISREKREGTLALLALTPLTPQGIVVGKSAVHLWRAASFLLAAAPVVAVALLMGGVSGTQLVMAMIVQFSALALAMVAGLFASAWTRQWIRSVVLAGLLAFVLWAFHVWLLDQTPGTRGGFLSGLGSRGPAWGGTLSLGVMTRLVLPTFAVTGVLLLSAQRRVRLASTDESLSKHQLWWLKTFCRPLPVLRELFRHRSGLKLDRNPIGWLQQYSWSARLTKWGWCAAMIMAETSAVINWYSFQKQQILLVFCLAVGIAFTAAGSFRRERQTGALELILVAPLQMDQIIFGRLKGIWNQFLPAALVVLLSAWFAISSSVAMNWPISSVAVFPLLVSTCLGVPVIGLYFSLKTRHFLSAWLLTIFVILWTLTIAPILAIFSGAFLYFTGVMPQFQRVAPIQESTFISSAVVQGVVALGFLRLLRRDLSRRNFPLETQIG